MIEIPAAPAYLIGAATLLYAVARSVALLLPLVSDRANERAVRLVTGKRKQG